MCEKLHPFEQAELGQAPFRCIGYSVEVGPKTLENGMQIGSPGQPVGTCDYCGQGIKYVAHIKSRDGRLFKVGFDCVKKVNRNDNRLLSSAKRQKALLDKKLRDEKKEAKRLARLAEREAELNQQREKNGGLTDYELQQETIRKEREAEEAKNYQRYSAENKWLLDVLAEVHQGNFVLSMIRELETSSLSGKSDRCLDILCDIYAKHHGRRNSKKYNQAYEFFYEMVGIEDE